MLTVDVNCSSRKRGPIQKMLHAAEIVWVHRTMALTRDSIVFAKLGSIIVTDTVQVCTFMVDAQLVFTTTISGKSEQCVDQYVCNHMNIQYIRHCFFQGVYVYMYLSMHACNCQQVRIFLFSILQAAACCQTFLIILHLCPPPFCPRCSRS